MGYGAFDEVLAGDLTGEDPDIESVVAAQVGDVEVYKVNHHGSRFSTNDAWLDETTPEAAIISVGGNSFGHPTAEALGRLHDHGRRIVVDGVGQGVEVGAALGSRHGYRLNRQIGRVRVEHLSAIGMHG